MSAIMKCFARIYRTRKQKSQKQANSVLRPIPTDELSQHGDAGIQTESPFTSSQTIAPVPTSRPHKPILPKIAIRKPTVIIPEAPDKELATPSPSANSLATPRLSRRSSDISQRSRSDSKASSTTEHWLKEQLDGARIECPRRPHCFFVPRCVQEKLINAENVSKDIQLRSFGISEDAARTYAERACGHARQLYAILAYIKKGADICALLEEGVTDDDLPFVRKPNARSRFSLHRKNGDAINALESWKDKYLENFDRYQWWMIAPVFTLNDELKELDEKMILPFMLLEPSIEEAERREGAYSEVYPVRIHPAHHEFWESIGDVRIEDEPLVAVKQLFNSDETEYLKEATILRHVGLKHHPHLIKLLGTYKQNGKYHLMFPFANANLRKYWDDCPAPLFDDATVLWSLAQMTGVANGLLKIHNFRVTHPLKVPGAGNIRMTKDVKLSVQQGEEWFGRHGDIKPENLLWFSQARGADHPLGVIRIADFGLGRFHGRDSRSGVNPDTVFSSPTYEPPECKLRQPVSRAYDLWSLGCLYLEFITWLLQGSAEIEGFAEFRGRMATGTGINDDNFFTIVTDTEGTRAIVRETVVIWTEKLHAHEKCSQLIHNLLDLIMGGLLIPEAKDRHQMSWVYQQLNAFLKKAKHDNTYMLSPAPHLQKHANTRSESTPALVGIPIANTKRNSISFVDGTKGAASKGASHTQGSPDLVRRSAGTPSFNPDHFGTHCTWPTGRRQTTP